MTPTKSEDMAEHQNEIYFFFLLKLSEWMVNGTLMGKNNLDWVKSVLCWMFVLFFVSPSRPPSHRVFRHTVYIWRSFWRTNHSRLSTNSQFEISFVFYYFFMIIFCRYPFDLNDYINVDCIGGKTPLTVETIDFLFLRSCQAVCRFYIHILLNYYWNTWFGW